MTASVVVVGSASRDRAVDDPRGWRLGGAVSYVGLALARLGMRPVVVMGGDEEVAAAAELQLLRDAGADVRLVLLDRSPVFDNREVGGTRRQHCLEPGASLPAAALPGDIRAVAHWVLAPVAGELEPAWAAVPPVDAFVALGWQGLLRDLRPDAPTRRVRPTRSALSMRADLVVVSQEDIGPGLEPATLGAALRPGARLVITAGTDGGTTWSAEPDGARPARAYRAIPAAGTVDATGAGDVFLAGLVCAVLSHPLAGSGRHGADLRLAAAMASLVVEAPGLAGVPTIPHVVARLRASLTRR